MPFVVLLTEVFSNIHTVGVGHGKHKDRFVLGWSGCEVVKTLRERHGIEPAADKFTSGIICAAAVVSDCVHVRHPGPLSD